MFDFPPAIQNKQIKIQQIQINQHTILIMSTIDYHHAQYQLFENLQNNEYADRILGSFGPTLDELNQKYQTKPAILSLTCAEYINKIDSLQGKQIKFTGQGKQALFNGLSFILLAIGCKQNKYYPHLISIIKEHFFKPGVFSQYEALKRNRILNIIRNIEIQVISCGSVSEFIENNEEFHEAFQHVLNKIIESSQEVKTYEEIIQLIRKRFNIDIGKIQISNSYAKCWILGMQKKIFLLEEKDCFIIVTASTSTQPAKSMNQSAIQNKIQSQRSVSEGGQQVIIQASEESTPKFKQNQQSIRYRKKSHKNSFGGDFEITGYKQLASLVNRSQHESSSKKKQEKVRKLLSLKFQTQEMGCLTMEQESPNNGKEMEVRGEDMNQFLMRGSNIEGNRRKERVQRKRHITSSEIFNLMNRNKQKALSTGPQQLEQQSHSNTNSNNNSKNSKASNNEQAKSNQKNAVHQTTLGSENEVDNTNQSAENKMGNNNGTSNQGLLNPSTIGSQKQHFKFSFSKKDASKFIFKQIQSQYNDNDLERDIELDTEADIERQLRNGGIKASQISIASNQPLRSSLNHPKSNPNSLGLLSEDDYFKKREKNRRSLLLEANISPIQQQVQSSQREQTQQHSITQSQREVQNSQQHEQLEKKSNTSYNNKLFGQNNPNNEWVSINNNSNNKNYINIFKSKNRKFSYLTQPLSSSKNELFNGNAEEMRQSYMEEGNQTIPESPENASHHPSFFMNGKSSKNRVSKSPKKLHKNSQAVTESKPKKRRFQENPISFSQMINIKDDSNFSTHMQPNQRRPARLSMNSNILQYIKDNIMCYNEPEGWIRKQVIYYFGEHSYQNSHRRKPEIYIIDRTFSSQPPFPQIAQPNGPQNPNIPLSSYQNNHQNQTQPCLNNLEQNNTRYHKQNNLNSSQNKMNSGNSPSSNQQLINFQINCQNMAGNLSNVQIITNSNNKIRSTIDTSHTPPGTIHNSNTKQIKTLINIPPPSSLSNLPSDFNPQDKEDARNKGRSIKESNVNQNSNQSVKQGSEKNKYHKQYKDLENIQLNLRKGKNSGAQNSEKKKESMSSDKNSQKKDQTNLNITYPISSYNTMPNNIPISPSTVTTINTSTNPLSSILPSLSLTNLRNLDKEIKQKVAKEREILQRGRAQRSRDRSNILIYSPPHMPSSHPYQYYAHTNNRGQNMSFSPSKNVYHPYNPQTRQYNAVSQHLVTPKYPQFTPAYQPRTHFNIYQNQINFPSLNVHSSPPHLSMNRNLSPQSPKIIPQPQPNIVKNYNFYNHKYHIGTPLNSISVMPQPLQEHLKGFGVGTDRREGCFRNF